MIVGLVARQDAGLIGDPVGEPRRVGCQNRRCERGEQPRDDGDAQHQSDPARRMDGAGHLRRDYQCAGPRAAGRAGPGTGPAGPVHVRVPTANGTHPPSRRPRLDERLETPLAGLLALGAHDPVRRAAPVERRLRLEPRPRRRRSPETRSEERLVERQRARLVRVWDAVTGRARRTPAGPRRSCGLRPPVRPRGARSPHSSCCPCGAA